MQRTEPLFAESRDTFRAWTRCKQKTLRLPMDSQIRSSKRSRSPAHRAILALDLDCFYASVAIRARPHLKDKPVVIVQKHLCVTSNYVARNRAKGAVQKMTPVSNALKACPELVLIDGSDLTPFREASLEVLSITRAWLLERAQSISQRLRIDAPTCPCQRLGMDEIFVDMSTLVDAEIAAGGMPWKFDGHIFGSTADDSIRRFLMVSSQLAGQLRTHIIAKTSLTLCSGISDNKLLAKLAVNMHKPNDQTTFLPGEAASYLASLSPVALMGFGRGFYEKMQKWVEQHPPITKVECVRDVLAMFDTGKRGLQTLSKVLGSEATAIHILKICKGEDDSPVIDNGDAPKSISSDDSFRSCTTMTDLQKRVTIQTTRLMKRLRQDGQIYSRYPRTMTVGYRHRGQGYASTSRSVPIPMEIVSVCCSRQGGAEEKAIEVLCKVALKVLREHAGVHETSSFDMTFFSIGAATFMDMDQYNANTNTRNISDFFSKDRHSGGTSQKAVPDMEIDKSMKGLSCTTRTSFASANPRNISGDRKDLKKLCPICRMSLTGSNAIVNRHIDQCLGVEDRRPSAKKRRTGRQTMRVDSFFRKAGQ